MSIIEVISLQTLPTTDGQFTKRHRNIKRHLNNKTRNTA